jgi:hypothetical protein
LIKSIYKKKTKQTKPTTDIEPNANIPNIFPMRSGKNPGFPFFQLLLDPVQKLLAYVNSSEKEIKDFL